MRFPLTAQAWFDQLCRITDRPYTQAERTAGVKEEGPCK